MARELRRLLIDPDRLAGVDGPGGILPLRREEMHYLTRVLRLRRGDPLLVIDGRGGLWQAQCGDGAWLEALQPRGSASAPPRPGLCLALALPRQDVELFWRMATELGADRLQPLQAERCQGSGRRPALERWSAVIREATEQCERLWLPRLESCLPAADWLGRPGEGIRLLATTRQQGLPPLEHGLAEGTRQRHGEPGEINLAIGPEGGWTAAEEQRAQASGWCAVSLGDTILRTGTAAVAAVARIAAWRQLSC